MKFVLYWLVFISIASALSWFYQPTTNLVVVSALALVLLAAVVSWSALRLGSGSKPHFKILLVSLVAGFMHTQAMDIAYAVSFAPAGGRYSLLVETLILTALLALSSSLFLRLSSGSQKDKQSKRN